MALFLQTVKLSVTLRQGNLYQFCGYCFVFRVLSFPRFLRLFLRSFLMNEYLRFSVVLPLYVTAAFILSAP